MDETDFTMMRAEARVGTVLNGRWHLDKLIGLGGMAAVYAATHRNTKRVAIKILHPEISVDDNARQRFLREGYAANQVGQRGAVTADDDGTTDDGVAFLVMELLEGETLEERSARLGGRLKTREVLALMAQALATLEAAHAKGIVHRDLKPENLFLTRDGMVKVLDFGIARVADESSRKAPSQTQGIMGTPSFMAPEQARGRWEDVDHRTDLWAIGASMFSLFSGRFVHQAETANEALVAAVTERAPLLASVIPEVHPAIAALVDKALAYERELRFQTAAEFRAALQLADIAIAGDEALPSLRVPQAISIPVVQPGSLGLTTEGVAASVRAAQSNPTAPSKRRTTAPFALLGVAAVAGSILLGRGLVGVSGKPAAFSAAALVRAPASSSPARALTTGRDVAAPATSELATIARVATVFASLPPAPTPPNQIASSSRHSGVVAAQPRAPHVGKTLADLLKKRH